MHSSSEYVLGDRYPIHRACRDGDVGALEGLLTVHDDNGGQKQKRAVETGKPTNFFSEDSFYRWTPIHWASYHGHLACIRKLLFTAQTVINNNNGHHQQQRYLQDMWDSLINSQASNFQQTPLHLAAYGNHVECLQWLLDAGASPHITDALSETAAHKAARCGSFECLSSLVAHGVNLSVVNNAGQTAADIAAACGHTKCSAYLRTGGGLSTTEDTANIDNGMDIDQNDDHDQQEQPAAFVSGTYGYQPCYPKKHAVNGRKRGSQGDVLTMDEDAEKRCKKSWNKNYTAATEKQQSKESACAIRNSKDWMSSYCLM